jgi:hypothetical protein
MEEYFESFEHVLAVLHLHHAEAMAVVSPVKPTGQPGT